MEDASHYEEYTANNTIFYFIISKTRKPEDPLAKVAIAIQRDENNKIIETEFFNVEDEQPSEIILTKEIQNFHTILNKCKSDAEKRPMNVIMKLNSGLCTPEELTKLSDDESEQIRETVAQNTNTPVEVLTKLSNDENKWVRVDVAKNINTPVEILTKLSNDESEYVRDTVDRNTSR